MKKLFFALTLILTTSAFAQNIKCLPLAQETAPYFDFLNLSINGQKDVAGSYKAHNYGDKELKILGQDNDDWMKIDETPKARKNNKGQTVIVLQFNGKMGNDMDQYTLRFDEKSGEATLDMKYQTDCGDGLWHAEATQRFLCQSL